MNILITHPDFEIMGGVSNYLKQLQSKFHIPVQYLTVGKRSTEENSLRRISRILVDYWKFVRCLRRSDVDLVHINPSLDPKSFVRDGTLVLLAQLCRKKVVVFFHGWKDVFAARVERWYLPLFKWLFGKSDAFIVSCEHSRKTLVRWGVKQPIYAEVTAIDDDALADFDIKDALEKRQRSSVWRILFLSRVTKEKGIYELLRAMSLLQRRHRTIELVVVGTGQELKNARRFTHDNNISNVTFLGFVSEIRKRLLFEQANVFCLLSYTEGFPVSVIEAMAYGLPVVTRSVGGLADFFKNGEHGFISDSLDPNIFADFIEHLLVDSNLYNKISLSNYQYAQLHFLASDAVSRLEAIYETVLSSQ